MSNNDFLYLRKTGGIELEKSRFVFLTSPTLLLEILNFSMVSFAYFDSRNSFGVVVIVPYICMYTGESKGSICSLPVRISIL
jgi:hypothetical protein